MIRTSRSPSRASNAINHSNKLDSEAAAAAAAAASSTSTSTSTNPAYLSANLVYQPRPSSIRSVSTSSAASNNGTIAAALRAGSHTPDFGNEPSDMTDTQQACLTLPRPQRMQSRSPSHTAALIAAARAGRAKTEDTTPSTRRPAPRKTQSRPKSRSLINTPTDSSSIAPTTSLVSLFERKSSKTDSSNLAIRSPKPHRPDGIRSVFKMEVGSAGRLSRGGQQDARKEEMGFLAQVEQRSLNRQQQQRRSSEGDGENNNGAASWSAEGGRHNSRANQGGQIHQVGDAIECHDFADSGARSQTRSFRASTQERTAVNPPQLPIRSSTNTAASNLISSPPPYLQPSSRTQTAPMDVRPRPRPLSTYGSTLSTSAYSSQSVSATYRQLYPRKTTPLTNDDELANALVASNLASARLSSPQRRDPPPIPTSRRHSRHIFHSRTPSPVKTGLRQTLRKQESSDSDSDDATHPYGKHQKRRLIRKHPNKHHEGDRKRWRDAVTEGERKRYEGVWAANKGLLMPRDSADTFNDQVSNVIVKDIWGRSRLPEFELEAVWDLVDNEAAGRLSKEEFVVGMWLIDQRLKGRKLPVKVQSTVWASVRGIQGIKLRKQKT